jgi:hypothetical protein
MSHATDWTCRSCRAVLGRVCVGVLQPLAPIESVDGQGVALLRCPGCGPGRTWWPTGLGPVRVLADVPRTHTS